MKRKKLISLLLISSVAQSQLLPAMAQSTSVPAPRPLTVPATAPAASQPAKPPMSAAELEQLVAPVALYPDSLLSQIFMASTYPLEVVQADRFAKANPKLTGDPLTAELEKQSWDASVKSLVNFPTVLSMMSEKLDSTIKLGDAFLDDQKSVMDAVQRLRAKAQAQGNLQTTKEQTIIIEQAPAAPTTQVIRIEPATPEVIYVPTYNPTVVYGSWPYPAYPPYTYYPPGYVAAGVIGFGLGVAAGAAWGYAWGNCNWGGGDVDIDVNRNNNVNRNIDRSKYQNEINNLKNNRGEGAGNRGEGVGNRGNGAGNRFEHNPAHRDGVAYRDQKTNQKFGGGSNQAAQSRDAFRGRADAGRQDLSRGGADQFRGANAPSPSIQNRANQTGGAAQNRAGSAGSPGAANRAGGSGIQNRASTPSASNRAANSGLSGAGGGARSTQSASQRGTQSRAAAPRASSGGAARSSGGGARSSGGGGRAGGGGGGGRR